MVDDVSLRGLAMAALGGNPDRPAVRDHQRWYDWGWLRDTGAAVVDLLAVPDDRPVGLVARNRPTIVAALLALLADGRSVRMLYAYQSAQMLADQIASGTFGALIAADDDITSQVADAARLANICAISVHEEIGIGLVNEAGSEAAPPSPVGPPQPYIEVLTSGTTGPPRHFRISHDMILHRLLSMNVTYSPRPVARSGSHVSLIFYPLGTISGLYSFLPPALDGRPIILQEKFDIDGWLDHVVRYRPTRSSLPPVGIETLLARETPRGALRGLRYIGTGAAPLDVQLQTEFEEHFGVPLLISYGATEFGGPVTAMTAVLWKDWGRAKRGSAGRTWAGARLRVVDPLTGIELPRGTDGVLEVIAPAMGHVDWVRTADLAMIDADDFVFHRGRADGAITRGGFSILPETIEAALATHPQVAAAAVVGLPHRRLGEVPVAVVRPHDFATPPSADTLAVYLRDHVFATHVPTQFRFVRQLPMTASMKVDLAQVRALFDRKPRHE